MLKKLVFALSAVALLSSCEPFEGLLTANEAFNVTSTKNTKVQVVTIPAGAYDAKLEFPSSKKIQIKLKIADKKTTLNIDLARKLNIPDNGEFTIAAADLGQNFHAAGKSETRAELGPIQFGYESCTYQRRETHCFSNPQGQVVCRDHWVTVHGRRHVEYQDRQVDKKIQVGFYPDSTRYLATFTGEKSYTERLIRREGQCY